MALISPETCHLSSLSPSSNKRLLLQGPQLPTSPQSIHWTPSSAMSAGSASPSRYLAIFCSEESLACTQRLPCWERMQNVRVNGSTHVGCKGFVGCPSHLSSHGCAADITDLKVWVRRESMDLQVPDPQVQAPQASSTAPEIVLQLNWCHPKQGENSLSVLKSENVLQVNWGHPKQGENNVSVFKSGCVLIGFWLSLQGRLHELYRGFWHFAVLLTRPPETAAPPGSAPPPPPASRAPPFIPGESGSNRSFASKHPPQLRLWNCPSLRAAVLERSTSLMQLLSFSIHGTLAQVQLAGWRPTFVTTTPCLQSPARSQVKAQS